MWQYWAHITRQQVSGAELLWPFREAHIFQVPTVARGPGLLISIICLSPQDV